MRSNRGFMGNIIEGYHRHFLIVFDPLYFVIFKEESVKTFSLQSLVPQLSRYEENLQIPLLTRNGEQLKVTNSVPT